MIRTEVIFKNDQHQEPFRKGDTGYIDGYVRGGNDRPCAVVIGDDGYIGLAYIHNLKAIGLVSDARRQNQEQT